MFEYVRKLNCVRTLVFNQSEVKTTMDAKYYKAKVANLKKQAIEMVKVELSIDSIFCPPDFGYIILSEFSCWSSTRKELEMGSKIMDTSLFAVCFHQPRPWVYERFPQPQHLHGKEGWTRPRLQILLHHC